MKPFKRTLLSLLAIVLAVNGVAGANEKSISGVVAGKAQKGIDFNQAVVPILRQSCFPCHQPGAYDPGSSFPPNLIRKFRKAAAKAQVSFEMGMKFPFPFDDPPRKQLRDLEKALKKKTMPPENQGKLGAGSPLSESDRQILLKWVAQQKKAGKTKKKAGGS